MGPYRARASARADSDRPQPSTSDCRGSGGAAPEVSVAGTGRGAGTRAAAGAVSSERWLLGKEASVPSAGGPPVSRLADPTVAPAPVAQRRSRPRTRGPWPRSGVGRRFGPLERLSARRRRRAPPAGGTGAQARG